MDQIQLCEIIKKSLRRIVIDDGEQVISAGSGIAINEEGAVLTAKHVVAREATPFAGTITVKSQSDEPPVGYFLSSPPNFSVDINHPDLMHPIPIDLALLKPRTPVRSDYLDLYDGIAPVGTGVILAGFPDDVPLPLYFTDMPIRLTQGADDGCKSCTSSS